LGFLRILEKEFCWENKGVYLLSEGDREWVTTINSSPLSEFLLHKGILQKAILRMLTLHQVILHKDIHRVTLLKGILHKGTLSRAMDHRLLSMLSSNSRTVLPHLWKDVWLPSAAVVC
jgi:hypothetical protein